MRILIISRVEWDESKNFGNTYSSLFRGMNNVSIANIYCSYGKPNTSVAERFYCMNEKTIIQKIFNKQKHCGYEVYVEDESQTSIVKRKSYESIKKHRWQIFFWIRDLIWKTDVWKSKELLEFIDSFNPDIIFSPFYYSIYMNDIRSYIYKYLNIPMISFVSDDIYTMKQFNVSPLYWIDRLIIRKKVKQIAKFNKFIYVISEMQKKEYERILHPDCRILYKGANFNKIVNQKKAKKPIVIVFTGNVSSGRWKTLSKIGNAMHELNKHEQCLKLIIYTATPMTSTMKRALDIPGSIELEDAVSYDKIEQIQLDADVLLHCESFNLKEKLQVRLSFSTKLVDYFSRRRCIFAVGSNEVASIDYLIKNDAAIVAINEKQIFEKLKYIKENLNVIDEYADKAWLCGKNNHQIEEIQNRLYNDIAACINSNYC